MEESYHSLHIGLVAIKCRPGTEVSSRSSIFNFKPNVYVSLTYTHFLSAGVDHFSEHPLFKDSDIPITTSSGISGPTITEWMLLTTIALTKNYPILQENQKKHEWNSFGMGTMQAPDWGGKTVGILGYGGIGRQGELHS